MLPAKGRPALFLDRDGVLNDLVFYPDSAEWESPRTSRDLRVNPEAGPALRALQENWLLFVISNQPSFSKGKCRMEDLLAVDAAFQEAFRRDGVRFQETCYCFHHPQGLVAGYSGPCACRKPSPHFLLRAAQTHGLDLARSWMVGDQGTDILCGKRAGCRTILLPVSGSADKQGSESPDATAASWAEILSFLEEAK